MGSPHIFSGIFGGIASFFRWFFRRKLAILLFLLLLLALPAYIFYVNVYLAPPTAGHLASTSDPLKVDGDTLEIPANLESSVRDTLRLIGAMELEKVYAKNRLSLSQSDSVYMGIDLKNKQINLEIKGVVVRSCPIVSAEVSERLRNAGHDELLQWISTPFDLHHDLSTISKIPYVIKAAPKDTLEAQAQSSKPIPSDTAAVLFTLYFDRDLVVEIEQSEEPKPGDEPLIDYYFGIKNDAYRQAAIQAAKRFQPPERDIFIRLKVSSADARAIYRGIPINATMALRLQ